MRNQNHLNGITWSERNGCAGQTAWLAVIILVLLMLIGCKG
jgi:hypothetical protein